VLLIGSVWRNMEVGGWVGADVTSAVIIEILVFGFTSRNKRKYKNR